MTKRIFTKVLAVAIVMIMMLSVCAPIVSAASWEHDGHTHETEKDELVYVSLGDSMTNGYGLPGYDAEAGVYDYGNESYANQFAKWLSEEHGVEVDHRQLAMSAMRPEDLFFLLTLDYESAEASALLDKYPTDDNVFWDCGDHSGVAEEDIVYCHEHKWDHVYDTHVDDYPAWWTLVHGENWENEFAHFNLESKQSDNPSCGGGTDVCSHNYRNGLCQTQKSRIYETDRHNGSCGRGLYGTCDKRSS